MLDKDYNIIGKKEKKMHLNYVVFDLLCKPTILQVEKINFLGAKICGQRYKTTPTLHQVGWEQNSFSY